MPFTIRLESENGTTIKEVVDPRGILSHLLPGYDDFSFPMLRFIDPYGDTVFNRFQMRFFGKEMERILQKAKSKEEKDLLVEILELAAQGVTEVHLYLKFYGD